MVGNNVIAVRRAHIEWPYVESWCDRHGTQELLERLQQECSEP